MTKRYRAPSVRKAFEILRYIGTSKNGRGISEIARELNMSKGTVYGITHALEEVGALYKDPIKRKFYLGMALMELSRSTLAFMDIRDMARPIMEELMEKVQETVFLGFLNGERVTIVDVVESDQDIRIISPKGTSIPLFAGAVGKVFLSMMDENRARDIINRKGLPRFTDNSITDPDHYIQILKEVRKKDYATDYEEYLIGVRAVASPIKIIRGVPFALWVVGFKRTLDDNKMELLKREIKKASYKISKKITYSV